MDIYVLDKSFNRLTIIDDYHSILWIDRYNTPGEFELYIGADPYLLNFLQAGNYLTHKGSEHIMVIESIKTETDVENGNYFTITGHSIEYFLSRRIVWKQTDFNDIYLQTAIQRLLNENVISPSATERRIDGVIFEASTDPKVTSVKISAQYTGDNLLDAITEICNVADLGFKMTLNESNQFVFTLFSGTDRSYAQDENTYVIFSPNFDNIINTNYYETDQNYKNVNLVAGAGEGDERITLVVGDATGLERREMYTDARDLSETDEEGQEIPIEEYNEKLRQRGLEKLSEMKKEMSFDGKVDPNQTFVYGEDFFLVDIVQIRNEYGIEGSARIVEYVMSESVDNGLEYYPTFEAIPEDVEE